jgi:disulfide bond formation protein DsbB
MARLYVIAATVNVWVLILILLAAFGVQFVNNELPCPLCVMQRIALMLCAVGPLYLLVGQRDGEVAVRDVAVACGIAILAALFGAAASGRQVLLHILPNELGYGRPLFGLHLYTWALIAFLAQIAASAVMLVGTAWFADRRIPPWRYTVVTAAALAIVVLANIGSVIAESGLEWTLPENPVRYLLFRP